MGWPKHLFVAFALGVTVVSGRPETESKPVAQNDEKVSYNGAQVINVEAEKYVDFLEKLLDSGDAEKWGGNTTHFDVFVPKNKVSEIKSKLSEKQIKFNVKIDDVQSAIDQENPPIEDEDEFEGRRGHKMTWRSYHRLADIYGYLDYLAETYPELVSVGTLGSSVEGRPIKFVKISSGDQNAKKFWIDGGIHAREWISPAATTYIISELVENRNQHLSSVQGIDYYIVPVVNPDGYEYTHMSQRLWRKNRSKSNYFCPGTDLNRNWGYKWGGKGTSTENCREIYRGTGPFSEPETRAVSQFILNNRNNMKELWKDTEVKLLDKVQKLDYQLRQTVRQKNAENEELNKKLKKSYDIIKKLENELFAVKEEKSNLNQLNEELTMNIARLNSEIEEYKKEIKCWGRHESEKLAAIENNALIESKLSHANTELTRKQTEIIRLNGEIGRLRGELEKIRLGSVINHTTDTSNTITQLQAALAMERENCRDIAMERDSLTKEVIDLRRQLKDTEALVIKRSKSGICLPLSDSAGSPYNSVKSTPDRKPKLDQELLEYKEQLNATKKNLKDLQAKYDHDTFELEQQVKRIQRENLSLKHLLDDNPKPPKRGPMTNAKEDAHLLATIRGLKLELNAREKDIMRLNKELDDARKTNKRLQKEREKALNSNQGNKGRANQFHKEIEKPSSRDVSSHNEYNPLMFEENQETLIFLRTENRNLKEEIKRLEQDLISLHNKRIQDLSDLQEQHESEISRLIREHAAKHSTSTVAHLQSQLYTQQMVIHHLKDQVKEFEEQRNELALLRTERDQLETTLIEANKKIARLHDLASPENIQYSGLLEKLEFLERRHEVREQKLQTIVRDLVAKQSQGSTCSANCRDKLLNKNREICYYRAEMDKILATLAEFRWTK